MPAATPPGRVPSGRVLFAAPLPPPVTGRSAVSDRIRQEFLARGFDLVTLDTGRRRDGTVARLLRVLRLPLDLLRVAVLLWRHPDLGLLYTAVDDGRGTYFTALLAGLARLFGRRAVLHHHSFAYLAGRATRVVILLRLAGGDALHLTNCPRMARRFAEVYPEAGRVQSLSNAMMVAPGTGPASRPAPARALRVGHLSNLCREKGIEIVEASAYALLEAGVAFRLLLAGPVTDAAAGAVLQRLRERGIDFEHRGPVYGAAKADFLGELDLFLFPTIYPTETTALVVLEAAAAGVPFIALRRGCIDESFYSSGGYILDDPASFSAKAVSVARELGGDSPAWMALSQAARHCALARCAEARCDLAAFFAGLEPE